MTPTSPPASQVGGHVIDNVDDNPNYAPVQGAQASIVGDAALFVNTTVADFKDHGSANDSDEDMHDDETAANATPRAAPSSLGAEGEVPVFGDGGVVSASLANATAQASPPSLAAEGGVEAFGEVGAESVPTSGSNSEDVAMSDAVPAHGGTRKWTPENVQQYISKSVERAAAEADNMGKTRGLVSAALKAEGVTTFNGAQSKTALPDQYSFHWTLAASATVSAEVVAEAEPHSSSIYDKLVEDFNTSGFMIDEVPFTLVRFNNGYVSACKDYDDRNFGWTFEGLNLAAADDNVITRIHAKIRDFIEEKDIPISSERVSSRRVAPVRAFYFYKAPDGTVVKDGDRLSPLERGWFQSFCDEFVRQFPEARINKRPRVLHPDQHEDLKHAYVVAEINFLSEGHHLRDVSFNVNPKLAPQGPMGAITAHFSIGDHVCFQCLHNGHMKSQCNPHVLRPPRDMLVAPHVYEDLKTVKTPEDSPVQDDAWIMTNELSPPVIPNWQEKARKAKEDRERAEKQKKQEEDAKEAEKEVEQRKRVHSRRSSSSNSSFGGSTIDDFMTSGTTQRSSPLSNSKRQQREEVETRHKESTHKSQKYTLTPKPQNMYAGLTAEEDLEDPNSPANNSVGGTQAQATTLGPAYNAVNGAQAHATTLGPAHNAVNGAQAHATTLGPSTNPANVTQAQATTMGPGLTRKANPKSSPLKKFQKANRKKNPHATTMEFKSQPMDTPEVYEHDLDHMRATVANNPSTQIVITWETAQSQIQHAACVPASFLSQMSAAFIDRFNVLSLSAHNPHKHPVIDSLKLGQDSLGFSVTDFCHNDDGEEPCYTSFARFVEEQDTMMQTAIDSSFN